jgi:hypothetical protein
VEQVSEPLRRSALMLGNIPHGLISEFQQYSAIGRDTPRSISSLGYAHSQLRERKAVLRLLDELRTLSKRRYVSSASLAMVKDDAFGLLD